MTRRVAAVLKCMAVCAVVLYRQEAIAAEVEYKLGPQDVLQVKVFDIRAGSGEAHQWTAFNGDTYVDASGSISLPILGRIKVEGSTTTELSRTIAEQMQAKIGLAELPSASVQITKYRPFYVGGAVEKPGEYEFRPNLSIGQAISIAGGLYRLAPASRFAFDRDTVSQRGDLNALVKDDINLSMRRARLDAEIAGNANFTVTGQMLSKIDQADYMIAYNTEKALFDSRKSALDSQVRNIEETKAALVKELEALDKKAQSADYQFDLTQKDLIQVRELVAKGLSVSTRQLSAEQNAAAFENNRLDIQVARLRAQQEIGKLAREVIDLRSRMKQQALEEASQIRAKLQQNSIKEKSATDILGLINQASEFYSGRNSIPQYTITRRAGAKVSEILAKDGDSLEPGDVLAVKLIYDADSANLPPSKGEDGTEKRSQTTRSATGKDLD